MALNRYVSDEDLPAVLKQPLTFGNREQIDALNLLEIKINKAEERKAKIKKGRLIYFNVSIEYSGFTEMQILATDEEDAKTRAEEQFDSFDAAIDIDSISVSKIKDINIKTQPDVQKEAIK